MNPFILLCVGLVAIPLAGPFAVEPLIPAIGDLLTAKEFLVLLFIFNFVVSKIGMFPSAHNARFNPFAFFLLPTLAFSIYSAPPIKLQYFHENLGGIWMWESLAWALAYFLLYLAMLQLPIITQERQRLVAKCVCWAALLSSFYALLQWATLDQYQSVKLYMEIGNPIAKDVTAMIGNPTYLALWLAMCLPFCVKYAPRWQVAMVFVSILACQSDTASAGAILTLLFMAAMGARRTIWLKVAGVAVLVGLVLLVAFWGHARPKITDNGRFGIWAAAFEDWQKPPFQMPISPDMSKSQMHEAQKLNKRTYQLTGFGPGSFPFIFSPKYSTRFDSVHNEYLELLYSVGIFGLVQVLLAVGFVFWFAFNVARMEPFALVLYASLFMSCLAAITSPILHLEPLRFYAAMVFFMLSAMIPRR